MGKPIASAAEMGTRHGRTIHRVVGSDGRPLKNLDDQPVDGGGYRLENLAKMRAKEINDYYAKRDELLASQGNEDSQ